MIPVRFSGCYLNILGIWFLWLGLGANGQADRNKRFNLYPFAFFTKETSLSLGAASLLFFPDPKDTSAFVSNMQVTGQYSLRQQWNAEWWYQFYLREDRWRIFGFADMNQYPSLFFGVGNMPMEGEAYTSAFYRIRFSALKKIRKNLRAGFRYWFEHFRLVESTTDSYLLMHPEISRQSSPGLVWQYDSRNHPLFPSKGILAESSLLFSQTRLGATHRYASGLVDFRHFCQVRPKWVLANQVIFQWNSDNPHYNQLAMSGGGRILRGYFQGKYRDKFMQVWQQEWRYILSPRIKWNVFYAAGHVYRDLKTPPGPLLASLGTGLRFALVKKQQLHIRADVAISRHGDKGIYLMMEEAF
ncbi:MAG: BamA/TamA family outer membrane protein [Cytophagaceae bacterium]|jgi:outer membrane protein assembly factor BamA|nr:BamA/TamA family outer membrane protein [Cytophagaceae bacterium]